MAFDNLSDKLQMAMRRLTGKARLTDKDIEEMMKEVRLSLLEADVSLSVVKSFSESIKEKAMGDRILKGLNPSQQVVKIVNDELVELLGGKETQFEPSPPLTKILLSGLQGSGKTTSAAKLAQYLISNHQLKPLLVALDVYRPAAVDQLKTLGSSLGIEVYAEESKDPANIAKNALLKAEKEGFNTLIFDTAGRLHIDEEMIEEIEAIEKTVRPTHSFLVIDAMTGQDAVNVAKHFNEHLHLNGAILTKFDGDTRGGAALSLRMVANVPIVFMGVGEKTADLERFYPDRIASRILGMGDVLTLVDKVTENFSEADMMGMMEKMMSGHYNFEDFYKQLKMIKRMGSLGGLMKLIPGVNQALKNADVDESRLVSIEALIMSMTLKERKNPDLVKNSSSRRQRIARGSGRSVSELNRLIDGFDQQMKMAKRMQNIDPQNMDAMTPPMMNRPTKVKKGKGKNKGGFRF
jgi:signal recognition particle subunit SRP54